MYKLRLSFTVISDVYWFFIPNLHLLSTVLVNGFQSPQQLWNPMSKIVPGKFMGLAGIVNTTDYKTEPIFTVLGHGKLS